ncbi:MAG: methyltransferase [Pseudomonadota bacterium]
MNNPNPRFITRNPQPATRNMLLSDETLDSLFDGEIKLIQKKSGYRFSVDAVLLSHFPACKKGDAVLDLGCGCGVISAVLAYRHAQIRIYGVELQDELFELSERNIALNGYEERVAVIHGDLRMPKGILPEAFADWVVCNPPYRRLNSGRKNPNEQKSVARHEIAISLSRLMEAAGYFLKPRGRAVIIYPASRAAGLLSALSRLRLEPKRLQIVYSYPGCEGDFVLVEAVKGGGEELKIMPPFVIYDRSGEYSQEMRALYEKERPK